LDARASFLPVCATLIEDGGTEENNGILRSLFIMGSPSLGLPFLFL